MVKRPEDVLESDFKDLLKYWNSEKFKKMSETNTKHQSQYKDPHTAGKRGFAVIRNDLEKEKGSSDDLSLKEIFVATRKRKHDRVYKDSNGDTISKIAEMENIQSQRNEDNSQSIDAFAEVMGPEHPGRLRLYGRGVTKTTLKRKEHFEPSLSATDERIQEKMEEMEKRMHHRMVEKLEQQKTIILQQVTVDIFAQLNSMYPGLQLDANMLTTLCAQSPQPINRPSIGSNNNQGGENEQ